MCGNFTVSIPPVGELARQKRICFLAKSTESERPKAECQRRTACLLWMWSLLWKDGNHWTHSTVALGRLIKTWDFEGLHRMQLCSSYAICSLEAGRVIIIPSFPLVNEHAAPLDAVRLVNWCTVRRIPRTPPPPPPPPAPPCGNIVG